MGEPKRDERQEQNRQARILTELGIFLQGSQSGATTVPPTTPVPLLPSFHTRSPMSALFCTVITVSSQPIAAGLEAGKSTCARPSFTPSMIFFHNGGPGSSSVYVLLTHPIESAHT